ncbi:MAG TPA: hypothetical protein VK966_01185, partial [Longimicrobiales bacterium]|nr:hypothetical protein [Longimicrobiales bacterium]
VAVREGFKAVLAGEVGALGGGYVLTARVVAAADGATLVAVRETAPDSAGLIAAMNRLSKRVRERMGESLAALAAADPLPRVATSSLPALRRYAEAYDLAWAGGDDARIAELLEETVALDSMFAAAYRGLATTYWNMRADRQRALAAITRAYELRDRFSDRERYLVEATYHWQVEGQSGLTRQAYRRVLAVAPEDFTSRANLGLALLFDGEPEEAERVLREGIRPNAPAIIPINLAQALYFQGRTGEALEVLDSVSPGPGGGALNPFAENMRVRVLGGDGRWAEAESVARAVLAEFDASPHVRAEAHRALWHLALTRGRLAEAEREFAAMASLFERIGSLEALARAHVQRAEARLTLLGDAPGARSALDSLLDQPDLDVLTVGATIAPRAAAALAAAGDTARAIRLIDRWEALPPGERSDPDGYSAEHVRARTALVGGRTEEAVRRLERATDRTIQAINYLPDLARAYRDAGRVADAIAAFEEYLAFRHIRRIHRVPGHLAPVLMELADLYEATGDTEAAAATYLRLVELWAGADDELRSHVERAQARASALMGRDP